MAPELTAGQAAQAAPFVDIRIVDRWDSRRLAAMLRIAPEIVNAEIVAALEETGSLFERIGTDEAPEGALGGSGGLRGSTYHELRGTPARALLCGWAAPHAEYVDRGRRPGQRPPIAPLELWARKVLGVADDQARSVAFRLQRAIGRRGTRGNPFVLRTLYRLEPMARKILLRAADRAAARIRGEA